MAGQKREYYLGLDMGTSSVGWAVTDKNYRLLRAKGKDLWGIREFEEAQTAADRRSHRIDRRRHQRERVRIGFLKEYFCDALAEKDSTFLQRLENSKYRLEDKEEPVRNKSYIFCDRDYRDSDYFGKYPTIFHLRKELFSNPATHDVRLVYLALLNMFKHRGHFLSAGLSSEGSNRQLGDVYKAFCDALREETGISFEETIDVSFLEKVFSNRESSRTQKAEELAKIFHVDSKDKTKIGFIRAICGLKVNAKVLFEELVVQENAKVEICFSESGYEGREQEIADALGEGRYAIVESMKEMYDICALAGIMRGFTYLSEARVADYEKHKEDLKILKRTMKRYRTREEYNDFFRNESDGSYSAYVNSTNSGKKCRRDMDKRTEEELYKKIKELFKEVPKDTKDDDVVYIRQEMDRETFLPKQMTASNGIIPNQVHYREMKKILDNAEGYLPFLKEKDESGLTVSERILKLFSFQIPYYIGPVSERSKTGWVVRKEEGTVLPWNLENKIDVKRTSEEFIARMVRRCTYLSEERVLPKASLEYESFSVLNEINNIAIDGERISVPLKQRIYKELFQKGKKVTRKQLVSFLRAQGALQDEAQLSGIDIAINNSLSTYGKFRAILGDKVEEDSCKRMIENIVFWCTVYGDSKGFLREKIEEQYADQLTLEQIKRITGFKFKDWGKLSKEFLEMQGCEKSVGESVSLIRMMWETNGNLMEILNDTRYTYQEELKNRQNELVNVLTEMQPEDLDDYYFSAPVKRMVWQTLLIIRELEEVLGGPPTRLFVEMTRKPDEKPSRTISRKQKFLDLYKSIQEESRNWKSEIERADENGSLKSKKMYLYFTQMGRCMYTGETIELDQLFDDNLYDIDHIYPRHFVKDDNIDNNLVLVKKQVNAHKSDVYPLEENIHKRQKEFWRELLRLKLITEEKYSRLTGRMPFTEEQKAGFIARQLVETSQGTKGVADILKKILPETCIVYTKASNVAEFRQKRGLVKCRSVNEFHHAHDAYLNIVVGNIYYVKFTQNPLNFIKREYARDEEKHRYNLSRMFDWDVVRGEETAWVGAKEGGAQGTIAAVKEMLSKNTPLMTRRNFEAHGRIADQNPICAKKAKPENYISLKDSRDKRLADVTKYGGYTDIRVAYFFLVEHTINKKRVRTLETISVCRKDKLEGNEEELLKYCRDELRLVNPDIRMPKIKIQSLVKKDGYFVYISGKMGNRIRLTNAVNLCLKQEWMQWVKKLEKYKETKEIYGDISEEKNIALFELLTGKHQNGIYARRPNSVGEKLEKARDIFKQLKVFEQCEALNKLLGLTAIGVTSADLSLIGGGAQSGAMSMAKDITTGAKEILLVNQSVTGIYENVIDLLTV